MSQALSVKNQSKPKMSKKKKAVIVTAVLLLIAAVVMLILCIPTIMHRYRVINPMSPEDSAYIGEVAKTSQYVPDANVLASVNSSFENADTLPMSNNIYFWDYPELKANDMYYQAAICNRSDLEFDIEYYNSIIDVLGGVSDSQFGSQITASELREEISTVIDILPGYGQWFKVPEILHLYDSHKYFGNAYYVTYDKENDVISISRFSGAGGAATAYDNNSGTYYKNDTHSENLQNIKYYKNEQGIDVVECTNIDFMYINGKCVPVGIQKLINVENTSATKIVSTYIMSYDSPISNNRVVDLTYFRDGGYLNQIIQIDYSGSDDVKILTYSYTSSNEHIYTPNEGLLTLTDINPEGASLYFSKWDNLVSDEQMYPHIYLYGNLWIDDNGEELYYYSFDKNRFLQEGVQYMHPNVNGLLCEDCRNAGISSDGIIYDCKHGTYSDTYQRKMTQLVTSVPDHVYETDWIDSFVNERFTRFCTNFAWKKNFVFEVANESDLDVYVSDLASVLYDETISGIDLESVIKDYQDNYVDLPQENVDNIYMSRYIFGYNIEMTANLEQDVINYVVSCNISDGNKELPENSYFAILIQNSGYQNKDKFVILEKTAIGDLNNRYEVSGSLSLKDYCSLVLSDFDNIDNGSYFIGFAVVSENGGVYEKLSETHMLYVNVPSGEDGRWSVKYKITDGKKAHAFYIDNSLGTAMIYA